MFINRYIYIWLYDVCYILEWMCNTAREIEAATQPLCQRGWTSHSATLSDWAANGCGRVAEWQSGWVAAPAPLQTWQEKNRHPWKYERCTQDDLTPPLKATAATASRRAATQECWFVASMGLSTVIGLMLSTAKNSLVVACVHREFHNT